MWCPDCANENTKVIGTHISYDEVIRFRVCPICEFYFLTTEILKNDYIRFYENPK